ncbi:MAG TPA: methyltransferase domain-containing protein, partial [Candidatus Acidoferrales bacterium]|nr:methyltransferase domain-containing protein [Candidatus Acidoferrales bacterium]
SVVVTGFMLGLGLGSLAGGYLSRLPRAPLLAIFGGAELCTASYGAFSLRLFHYAALYANGGSFFGTAIMSFVLLLVPTMLMGSTLPLLVEHLVRESRNVGKSLGLLYFVNTLGSAAACYFAAGLTMGLLGQSGSVMLAAALNAAIGIGVLTMHYARRVAPSVVVASGEGVAPAGAEATRNELLPLPLAALFVAVAGFIALAYEVVWYRLFSFWSGSSARIFASLLGAYLAGIAVGGLIVHDLTSRAERGRNLQEYLRLAASFVVLANLAGFAVAPAMGLVAPHNAASAAFLLVAVAAALLGAVFPIICHISLATESRTGSGLSLLYFSNILGSALGSFLTGFVIMNLWGVRAISVFLAIVGVALGIALMLASKPSVRLRAAWLLGGAATCAVVAAVANPLFNRLYEKMLFKADYARKGAFRHLVENRSGVIAVASDGAVFGGGVYDGYFNVDLVRDVNGIFRAFALSSFHPAPERVLMIGLGSGSWAQIIANHPQVQEFTVVEINPGYLQLIQDYPAVASVLTNSKVRFVTDDARRWLSANPHATFDAIVMNMTFNWREHASNLLSVEFLELARKHLRPGGVLYYNTTGSLEVLLTGATVFPYALRVGNFLAVSDRPLEVNSERLEKTLRDYRIDGKPVLNLADANDSRRLQELLAMTRRFNTDEDLRVPSMEFADSIRRRCRGVRVVTDDNMGTEWSH